MIADNGKNDLTVAYLVALGGKENIMLVDACTNRLRLQVVENDMISEAELKKLGATVIIKHGKKNIQVVVGTKAKIMAKQIRALLTQGVHNE